MAGILIVGAGGHAKVVADILLCQNVNVAGFVDDAATLWNTRVLGLPVLGPIDDWMDFRPDRLAMGIGANAVRLSIVERLGEEASSLWCTAIHPSALIAKSSQVNPGTVIMAGAIINPDSRIGAHAIINTSATVDHDCSIGDFVHVAPGTNLGGGVRIGAGTLVGIGSAIAPYRTIGKWSTIGAGAVVVHDVPDHVVARGIPARWEQTQSEEPL
jgi:sugar O-acyltransferase (sialic acid O-acetyltransferase NeuD family)